MLQDYARNHILFGLVPAFFIAGAITTGIRKETVSRYFSSSKKIVPYAVASVSGVLLTVCSCTVLPMFSGIYKRGAGLGPAVAFLYSGPAINVLAIVLSFKVLGTQMGAARAVGSILFSILIGILMHLIYRGDDINRADDTGFNTAEQVPGQKPLHRTVLFLMVLILIMLCLGISSALGSVCRYKWLFAALLAAVLVTMLIRWYDAGERVAWVKSSLSFIEQIVPLLLAGILLSGFLLGRPGHDGVIPSEWIESMVGGNSIRANIIASFIGALMYFCTLVEIPVVQGLIGSGMGKGPALSLLLAGPALSLPNMLVVMKIMGIKKTMTYVFLVVVLAALSGVFFGRLAG